jgi:transcriptional regulator with XRE-family HTH domain
MYNLIMIGGDRMTETQKNVLSEEIKLQRFLKKKTQEECANALNMSIPTYKNYEDNPNKLDVEQALVLAKFLDWNIFEFFLKEILQNAIKEEG